MSSLQKSQGVGVAVVVAAVVGVVCSCGTPIFGGFEERERGWWIGMEEGKGRRENGDK